MMVPAWAWGVVLFVLDTITWVKSAIFGQIEASDEDTWTITKVFAFNVTDPEENISFDDWTDPPEVLPGDWFDTISAVTGWDMDDMRLEVRYEYIPAKTTKVIKYRVVLRRDMIMPFPPEAPKPGFCPWAVLAARLIGPDETVNVTDRVAKYAGPQKDFHKQTYKCLRVDEPGLRVHEMFPFDDHVMNSQRFTHLELIDARATVHRIPYAPNPPIGLSGRKLRSHNVVT